MGPSSRINVSPKLSKKIEQNLGIDVRRMKGRLSSTHSFVVEMQKAREKKQEREAEREGGKK